MKRPSLQLYTADWQANAKLRRCSHAEKGAWLDVMCILHDQDEYGIVRWPLKDLALAVHARVALLQALVDKHVLKGIDSGNCDAFVFTPRHGRKDGEPVTLIKPQPGPLWYSSRMVRDEYVREVRGDNEPKPAPKPAPKAGGLGSLGAHPTLHPSRERAPAAVSSSSSSSSSTPEKKKDSVAKPTGASAAIPKGVSVEDFTIWQLGVAKLVGTGSQEQAARSFLGEQVRKFGKGHVARAMTEALAQDAVEPRAYIVKVLQNGESNGKSEAGSGKGSRTSAVDAGFRGSIT